MASGLPVVAVDAGALAELVRPGENGFLATPGHARQIADGLDLLSRDADLRARMSEASSRIIAGHDEHRVLSRWESIYRALVSPDVGETRESAEQQNRRR
jgi:glycosyltransferase involved in cell wall biosynthesis